MKNKVFKLLMIVLILIIGFSIEIKAKDTIDVEDWIPDTNASNIKLINIGARILGTIQVVGSVMSVAVLSIIGIKYMFASIEERVEYKKSMYPYILGCIMVFATTNIAAIIYEISKKI